ncbi:hypothetical protein RB596_008336 [Gaeumannomyces avenae]
MGSFGCLSPELLDPILGQLDRSDVSRLSRTCRALRAALAPRLFEHVVIDDTSRSADSAYLGAQTHGGATKSLSLDITYNECTIVGCCIASHDLTRCPFLAANFGMGLPPSAEALLSGQFLPRLGKVEVRFWITDEHSTLYYRAYPSDVGPDWKFPDMVDVARAVVTSLRRNKTIKTLALMNYPPFNPLEFLHTPEDTASWTGLLGRLDDFSLSTFRHPIRYAHNGDTHDATFQDSMPAAFFDHLRSVRRLAISHPTAPSFAIGAANPHQSQPFVHLRRGVMPCLEELEIGTVVLTRELARCLIDMGTKSLSLTLRGTSRASSHARTTGVVTWKRFFGLLVDGRAFAGDFSLTLGSGRPGRPGLRRLAVQEPVGAHERRAQELGRASFPHHSIFVIQHSFDDRMTRIWAAAAERRKEGEEGYCRLIEQIKASYAKV